MVMNKISGDEMKVVYTNEAAKSCCSGVECGIDGRAT